MKQSILKNTKPGKRDIRVQGIFSATKAAMIHDVLIELFLSFVCSKKSDS